MDKKKKDKKLKPSTWDRFKEGFLPMKERADLEVYRKSKKKKDYKRYEHGGIAKNPRREALRQIAKKYSK